MTIALQGTGQIRLLSTWEMRAKLLDEEASELGTLLLCRWHAYGAGTEQLLVCSQISCRSTRRLKFHIDEEGIRTSMI